MVVDYGEDFEGFSHYFGAGVVAWKDQDLVGW